MEGIVLNELLSLKPSQSEGLSSQKSNFMDYNLEKPTGDEFSSYLNKAKGDYGVKSNSPYAPDQRSKIDQNREYPDRQDNSNRINDEGIEKNNQGQNSLQKDIDSSNSKIAQLIQDKIDEIKEKIKNLSSNQDEKNDKVQSAGTKAVWETLVELLQQLQQLSKGQTDGSLSDEFKAILKGLELKLTGNNENAPLNDKLLKDIKSFFKELSDILNSELKSETDSNSLTSKGKFSQDKIKDLLSEIETLFKNVSSEKEKFNSDKIISKTQVQQGIRFSSVKEKTKADTAKENAKQEGQEVQSVTNQKGELKFNQVIDSSEAKMDSSGQEGKSMLLDRGLRLPKGSSIRNPGELFDQIVSKAQMSIANRRSEIQIQLEPKILGQANLKIVVENGIVSGRFLVENKMVKEFLEENIHILKENLEARGLEFDAINVELGNQGRGPNLEREELHKQMVQGFNNTVNNDNLAMTEEVLTGRYMLPDWVATEVNVVI